MKVSLVATVKDAAPHLRAFLSSVEAQTRMPDEVVIVDGGSTDGTAEILRDADGITLIEEPGSNIARGRNVAIRAAAHDVVAVSDADCVLAPDWVERVVAPVERGADVSMGVYRALSGSFFEACAAAISIRDPEELDPSTYLPSARSVAFRREAFERGGGYPEWLDIGEDMYLNHRWRGLGLRMELAGDAVAYRRPRAGLGEYWLQFFRYAEGDARGGMHPRRHALRFAVYGALALVLAVPGRPPKLLAASAGALYAARPVRRARRLLPPGRPRLAAVVAVPALMAVTDAAKMAGCLFGLAGRGGDREAEVGRTHRVTEALA
jgi:glycosyltransferase involved in cell wall biosynthesis